jgi:23S rRNA (cytidine1920-2'-O)/16S rRNA (cytidine1409-2'-O)-methyltransferase
VSRGAEKIAGAIQRWRVPVSGRVWLDAGSSTGGFTDYLLQNGARFVHAVDVGYNQLDYRLRRDPRVGTHERTNIAGVGRADLTPAPDAAVADLSFRSLRGVARHIIELTNDRLAIALAKPQFEWRNPAPEFDGVIESRDDCREVMLELIRGLAAEGVVVLRMAPSPIRGRRGNAEFFFMLTDASSGGGTTGFVQSPILPDELESSLDEVFP